MLFPKVDFGDGRTVSLVVSNRGQHLGDFEVSTFDLAGTLIETLLDVAPGPGKWKTYRAEGAAWLQGASSMKLRSHVDLEGWLVVQSLDGSLLECVPAGRANSNSLTFPLFETVGLGEVVVQNVGLRSSEIQVFLLNEFGSQLATVKYRPLTPMALANFRPAELFDSGMLASSSAIHVVGNQPLEGLAIYLWRDGADFAAVRRPSVAPHHSLAIALPSSDRVVSLSHLVRVSQSERIPCLC